MFRVLWIFVVLHLPLQCVLFDKVVVWGHKLHTHTHSYIHNGFYIGFKHLGYDTYWFDNDDDVSLFDFSNTLFLTEGQVDGKIPIRDDCYYILHNCTLSKYQVLPQKNCIAMQVYTDSVLKYHFTEVDKCIYYDIKGRCVYMPWATDLLPDQIEEMKKTIKPLDSKNRVVYWVGTIGDGRFGNIEQLTPFIQACQESDVCFVHAGITKLTIEENIRFIQDSYVAPAIVGRWQKEVGYIPCRIFKNISYGKMGVTNSSQVYELFDRKIVYHPDEYQLFYAAEERLKALKLEELFALMDVVKTKHTFIQRIGTLLHFFDLVQNGGFPELQNDCQK